MRAEKAGALKVLDDPLAAIATAEIVPGNRSRYEIQRAIKVRAPPPHCDEGLVMAHWLVQHRTAMPFHP